MNLFNHVHAVGVDVALGDVDDLDSVGQAGLFADAPIGKKIPKSFSFYQTVWYIKFIKSVTSKAQNIQTIKC